MSGSFFKELKRRNVFRVAVIYIVISWLLMQIGDVMFPALRLPDWSTTLLIAFLILGLPVALIFAWAFELTPEGVVRTEDVPPEASITATTGHKINHMIIAVLALAVVFLLARIWLLDEAAPESEALASDRSIAVLPFKNQSASEENAEFFSGGLHDELLTLLSRIGDLKVISRTSVERLDPTLSIPEIGALLGVATVLEGQVQRAGDRLRINVQLIDTAEEGHLWANTYNSELTAENVFEVQGDIARTIADALHAELSPDDEKLLNAIGTENLEALENYLLGAQIAERNTYADLEEGAAYLVEATQLDPEFAQAWTELAVVYSNQFATGAIGYEDYVAKAGSAVQIAIRLDPMSAEAHAVSGTLHLSKGNVEAAEASYREALRLNPDNVLGREEYGMFLRVVGRPEDALAVLEPALATDPLSTSLLFQLGKAEMYAGRPERTVAYSERIIEIDPSNVQSYTNLLQAYLWMGRIDLAIPWFVRSLEVDPGDYENWAHIALHFDQLGDTATADRYLSRAESLGPDEPAVLKCKAVLENYRGNIESAVAISRAAIEAQLDDRWGSDQVFLSILRDRALQSGEFEEMLGLYRTRWPELFLTDPQPDLYNFYIVPDVVLLMQHAGLEREGKSLADATIDWYVENLPDGVYGWVYGIIKAELLAVAGETDAALLELRRAIDSGWRLSWRFFMLGRNLDSIKEEPRYLDMVAEVRADMVAQGERLRQTPHMGEYDLREQPQ
jgi:TolB-like protein/Tfp pilus assembly protein PilF